MRKEVQAKFYPCPRTAEEMKKPYDLTQTVDFEIVKRIELSNIDFENFATDMLVERVFLEENASICSSAVKPLKVLQVITAGKANSILVVPDAEGFVKYASLWDTTISPCSH